MSSQNVNKAPQRRSIRLQGYDYSAHGGYFLTICTDGRKYLFGDIAKGEMKLSRYGEIVSACWHEIPAHFDFVRLDTFVVMPNHVHGILILTGAGTACRAPTTPRFGTARHGTLSTVTGSFKSAVTKGINHLRSTPGASVWQRNYYEHIIRTEAELNKIREYIITPLYPFKTRNKVDPASDSKPMFELPHSLSLEQTR